VGRRRHHSGVSAPIPGVVRKCACRCGENDYDTRDPCRSVVPDVHGIAAFRPLSPIGSKCSQARFAVRLVGNIEEQYHGCRSQEGG
jgi:hypothetical protein